MDATRAGNMAHLLNHSCDPNCSSRIITVRDESTGELVDHVIIFAKVTMWPLDCINAINGGTTC